MSNCRGVYFEEQLYKLIGQYVVLIIKSGDDCCKHSGILCGIEEDFVVLISNNTRTEILIDAVVAIKKRVCKSKY